MHEYIKELTDSLLQEDTKGSKHTMAPEDLFLTDDEDAIKL